MPVLGLIRSDRRQRLGLGHGPAQGSVFVQVAEHLDADALVQAAYQLDHLPSQQEVLAIAEKWRPYRSLATSYLFSAAFEPAEAPGR